MSTSHILTNAGFVKISLPILTQNNPKVRLYHLQDLSKAAAATVALLQEMQKRRTYQGDLNAFEEEIHKKPYLIKSETILELAEGIVTQAHDKTIQHQIKISQKTRYLFEKVVHVGRDFKVTGENATIVININIHPTPSPIPKSLTSQEKPLSQLTALLAKDLICFYQEQITAVYKIRAKGAWTISLPIEGVFTELAMICEEERKTKNDLNKTGKGIPVHEALNPQQPIAPQEIFNHEKLKNAPRKRAVIFGVAGVGKTTLCQMLAQKGTTLWPQFKVIFFIKLRHLNEKEYPRRAEGYTPYELLAKECHFDLITYQPLLNDPKFLEESLLLLDGYDELPKEAENGSLSKTFQKLQEIFPHILMTSRPTLVNMDYLAELEILGFDSKNINTYIEKFFKLLVQKKEISEEEAKRKTLKLQQEINKRSLLASLLQIPINLALACSLCRENETFFDSNQPASVTSFYLEAVNWFYKKYQLRPGVSDQSEASIRQQKNPRTVCKKTDHLAKTSEEIAWWAMQQNTLYIDQDVIERILGENGLNLDDLIHLGLLSLEEGQGQFIHLTFQEYFAALYLANLYLTDKTDKGKELVAQNKSIERFFHVFWKAAGYLSSQRDPASLKAFFKDLVSEPHDLAMRYGLRLLVRCFEECQDPTILEQYNPFMEQILAYLQQDLPKELVIALVVKTRLLRQGKVAQFYEKRLAEQATQNATVEVLASLAFKKQIFSEKILLIMSQIVRDPEAGSSVQSSAVLALGEVARSGQTLPPRVMEALTALLRDPQADWWNRSQATRALGDVARSGQALPPGAVEALSALLRDPQADAWNRGWAGIALGEVAQSGQALPPGVVEAIMAALLRDPHSSVRSKAAEALVEVARSGEVPPGAAEALLAFLIDPQAGWWNRSSVAKALGEVAAQSPGAVEAMMALLRDPQADSWNRGWAVKALVEVARSGQALPPGAAEALLAFLRSSC